jgi:hypothetical protein
MLIRGQPVSDAQCLQVSPKVIYYGQVKKNDGGTLIRHGLGIQLVLTDSLDREGQIYCKYEGEWQNDKMHGEGKLEMGPETYEGDFYEGLANGNPM